MSKNKNFSNSTVGGESNLSQLLLDHVTASPQQSPYTRPTNMPPHRSHNLYYQHQPTAICSSSRATSHHITNDINLPSDNKNSFSHYSSLRHDSVVIPIYTNETVLTSYQSLLNDTQHNDGDIGSHISTTNINNGGLLPNLQSNSNNIFSNDSLIRSYQTRPIAILHQPSLTK